MANERQVEHAPASWNREAAAREILGYLNFSAGKPDPRVQRNSSEFYRHSLEAAPWQALHRWLSDELEAMRGSSAAFCSTEQAEAVLSITFDRALPAYRQHHRDQLAHLSDGDLFRPFFVARVLEAVLAQGGPWHEADRIVRDAIRQLNDFVGHRPVAVLERQKCEPYQHERARPIPLYIRGAGAAAGQYQGLVEHALEILARTDPEILAQAHFSLDLLDELALDPRAYDFSHPVNQRPNYQFGEWDPHTLDNQGRYRRFVVRQVILDALLERVQGSKRGQGSGVRGQGSEEAGETCEAGAHASGPQPSTLNPQLFEAAAVLAGTMLMASGISGSGPDTHDSSVTLETLVPKIARYRDAFYEQLLESVSGPHGERLRREAQIMHQPFGGARQHLNQYLARQRAAQLQHAHLARMFAQMGYPEASREEARKIPTASARMLGELHGAITVTRLMLDRGELAQAAGEMPAIEDLLQRGISCGAIVDPWNILGFQGQFSIFAALENTVPDPRVEELTELMELMFTLHARLLAESAATGSAALEKSVADRFRRLVTWWDKFASVEIGGVRRVHGQETLASARHVAKALAAWHAAGESAGDIAFWRRHSDGFNSPRAYAQVVQALLAKNDYVAAMALLMHWLSQVAEVPLEQGTHSFRTLAVRWLSGVRQGDGSGVRGQESASTESRKSHSDSQWALVKKFFDFLEANAEEYWHVPALEEGSNIEEGADAESSGDEADDTFAAAYEGVSYRDSAEDGHAGEMLEGGPPRQDFYLDFAAERLEPRLRFLTTVAELWQIAAAQIDAPGAETLRGWFDQAQRNRRGLARLLEAIQEYPIPQPLGSHDSMVEFDRRRATKENLIYAVIAAEVQATHAARQLLCALGEPADAGLAEWERLAVDLERALSRADRAGVTQKLPQFLDAVGQQPLLYRPLAKGGHPIQIIQAKSIQQALRTLVRALPRLGLLRETYHVLRTARLMEQRHAISGGVTEFDHLFRAGFAAVVESLVDASQSWPDERRSDEGLLEYLEDMTEPFLRLWLEHSQTLRLSALERIGGNDEWQGVRQFIESYGRDLFTPRFLTLANLRAILDHGVPRWLEYQEENQDPLRPISLIDALGNRITRDDAARHLELILQTFVENYEEYKDYNATTTSSDYGERYFILLEFLRIKSWYDRAAWNLQPVAVAHEVLARRGRSAAAQLWQDAVRQKTADIADSLCARLKELEAAYGVRMPTIADHLGEHFTKPLTLDRIRILIEPAIEAARGGKPHPESFARFREALHDYADTPTGVGLEVPQWIRTLEHEVHRVRAHEHGLLEPLETHLRLPRAPLSHEDLDRQLEIWDRPL
jgi:hypothetical protein